MLRTASLLLLLMASPAAAQVGANPLTDGQLAQMRGGFALPGGIDVSLAVQTDTSLNGALILRSIFRADQGLAALQVFAPVAGTQVAGPRAAGTGLTQAGSVSVRFDRQGGVALLPAQAVGPNVLVSGASTPDSAATTGLEHVALGTGEIGQTSVGQVAVEPLRNGSRVHLQGDGLDVSHIYGNAFGSVVANAASDRVVDTVTTVSVDLVGATPANLGSTLFRVEALGLESTRMLGR